MAEAIDFPDLIRRLREARALTQEQLATELGVVFSSVNAWENGKRRPIPVHAKLLLEFARKAGIEPTTPKPRARGRKPAPRTRKK